MLSRSRRSARFAEIYENNEWNSEETRSGRGSDLDATLQVVRIVDAAIIFTRARTLLDAGCGERHWLRGVRAPISRYLGVDIVTQLTSEEGGRALPDHWLRTGFLCADIVCDELPASDLILCRDVLPHFSVEDIFAAIATMKRSGSRFLLATSFAGRANEDIETGLWRPLNLEAPPFNFPSPTKRWFEDCPLDGGKYRDKCLNLWRLDALSIP